ncbi:nicotinamidase isoform X1 [Tribolium castaneum]|nr:PREDICTED: pyrazinamidase/nicotinamidase isoform X1 [Tribolium castaneum]|eukprot:XP_967306.3 PREDICTED: pyrazinamidase/nicotinamidase isoform X1 [Tribolium castaneum]
MTGSTNRIDFVNFICTCSMDACFAAFDKDCDGKLNLEEFWALCRALFRNSKGVTYEIERHTLETIFNVFDKNQDGSIDRDEFVTCWNLWIKTIVKPVSAALIIDVQNDFITGSLNITNCPAKHHGGDVIQPINNLLETVEFETVVYSYDWHPNDHVSFIDNISLRKLHESSPISAENAKVYDTVVFDREPPMVQKLWPRHCVQNTWGSDLHKDLKVVENSTKIYKGTNPDVDSYSLFWDNQKLTDTKLDSLLRARNITDLYLCGLAYDVCVASTAKDAIASGYRTVLLDDCCRGVDLLDIEKTKNFIQENHGLVVDSSQVKEMVEGNDRRPELGLKLALELQQKRQ